MEDTTQEYDLTRKKCKPCEGGVRPMNHEEITDKLKQVEDWEYAGGRIGKSFKFKDHYETIAFVNAVAWISNREGHHPDLEVGYDTCNVYYSTHAIGGMSENDFICAAKVDQLLK
jgi:4a-hydroxytetrahydrobiopterin dehydratase